VWGVYASELSIAILWGSVAKAMVRPSKDGRERRSELLSLRLTVSEKASIETQAGQTGLSVTEYARRILIGKRLPDTIDLTTASLITELNRIGVSLRSHFTSASTGCDPDLDDVLARIENALEKLAVRDGS